jgi:hypothetical protein
MGKPNRAKLPRIPDLPAHATAGSDHGVQHELASFLSYDLLQRSVNCKAELPTRPVPEEWPTKAAPVPIYPYPASVTFPPFPDAAPEMDAVK